MAKTTATAATPAKKNNKSGKGSRARTKLRRKEERKIQKRLRYAAAQRRDGGQVAQEANSGGNTRRTNHHRGHAAEKAMTRFDNAMERRIYRDSLSAEDQLRRLDDRVGSNGAQKERTRLLSEIAARKTN